MNRPSLRSAADTPAGEAASRQASPHDAHAGDRDGLLSVLSLEDLRAQAPARHPMRWLWWGLAGVSLLCVAWMAVLAWPAPDHGPRRAPAADVLAREPAPPPQDLTPAAPLSAGAAEILQMPTEPAAAPVVAAAATVATAALAPTATPTSSPAVKPSSKAPTKARERAKANAPNARKTANATSGKAAVPHQPDADAELLAALVQHIDRKPPPLDFNEPVGPNQVTLAHCRKLRGADAAQCRAQACSGRWGIDVACPMRRGTEP